MGRHKEKLVEKNITLSFRIKGDTKIVAEKRELLQLEQKNEERKCGEFCIVTGGYGPMVETTTSTMIPGSQATAKLVAFQVNSGYDSYGKKSVVMLR